MSRVVIFTLFLTALAAAAKDPAGETRIWMDVRISGQRVRLAFDSGATHSALTPAAVQRLGLKTLPLSTNDVPPAFASMATEKLPLTFEGSEGRIKFLVLNLPEYAPADFDGLISWRDLGGCVVRLSAARGQVELLRTLPKLPPQTIRLPIALRSGTLDITIPNPPATNRVLCIDTGTPDGVALPPAEWQRWKSAHPHNPVTLDSAFTPSDGFFLFEQAWADHLQVGPLSLTAVPVESAAPAASERNGPQYAGTLGLAALRQFDLVIDGPGGHVYLQPKKVHTKPYPHNRLGAVFVPTAGHTNQGIATVVQGSPAYTAGVRNGDRLLQVDQVTVQSWSDDWLAKFQMPAGTKLKLKLERNGTNFTTIATLREIVGEKAAHDK